MNLNSFVYDDSGKFVTYRSFKFFPVTEVDFYPDGSLYQDFEGPDGRFISAYWNPSDEYSKVSGKVAELEAVLSSRSHHGTVPEFEALVGDELSRLRERASYLFCNGFAFDANKPFLVKEVL